jgi:hypothetical protein
MEGDFFIEVETAAGVKQGVIDQVSYWESDDLLSKNGSIRFEIPARSPQAALVAHDRVVTCYAEVNNDLAEQGSGIVKRVEFRASSRGRESLLVSGPGRMHELTRRLVETLKLATTQWVTPLRVLEHDPIGGTNTDLPYTYDDNVITFNNVTLASTDYLYILMSTGTSGARFNLTATNNNVETMTVQYYRAAEWIAVSNFSDGTLSGGATLGKSGVGDMTWDLPDDADIVSHNGERGYWVRMTPSGDLDQVRIAEIDVRVDAPVTTGLADIIACHPDWSVDATPSHGTGYSTTSDEVYHQFSYETVLAALFWLSEQTGEHFRYGGGQTIVWMRETQTDSGIRADLEADPIAAEDEAGICHIVDLKEVGDSYDMITRVYPFGAGMGASRVDLSLATMSMPTGYVLDTANNCIIYKPGGTEPTPRVDRTKNWPDVRAAEARDGKSEEASNALAARALEYLQDHVAVSKAYNIELAGLKGRLYPLDTLHVTYQVWREGELPIDIDDDLAVLSATTRVDARGIRTVRVTAATAAVWPMSPAAVGAEGIHQMQMSYAHGQPIW